MKQIELLKILAKDMKAKSPDLVEVNKALKAKNAPAIKYRLSGKKMGHYGFTGLIKALTAEGVKVFDVKKVTLIPYDSIENMEHAKPREKRPVRAEKVAEVPVKKATPVTKPKATAVVVEDEEFAVRKSKKKSSVTEHAGSKYIPRR
jgi:hypothetical protein